MKFLILRGNPRKTGLSEKLGNLFKEGLKDANAEIFDIDLAAQNIAPCKGCFACVKTGKCVQNDNMQNILCLLKECDAIVCISPVYFYSTSSLVKIFFDRCFPLIDGYTYNAKNNAVENSTALKGKKFITISCALGRKNSAFGVIGQTYSSIASALNLNYIANICRGEAPLLGENSQTSLRVRKIFAAFREMGKELGEKDEISQSSIDVAELYLSLSDEQFAKNAKIFWDIEKRR